MNHICPHCNSILNTDGFQPGQLITCAVCRKQFQLPREEVTQQPVTPPSNVPPALPSPPPLPPAKVAPPANTAAVIQDPIPSQAPYVGHATSSSTISSPTNTGSVVQESANSQAPFVVTDTSSPPRQTSNRRSLSNKTNAPQNTNTILAITGLVALFIGIFTPIMSLGPGSVSLFDSLQNSQGLSRGLFCLLLACLGIGSCITYFLTKQSMYLLTAAIASTIAAVIFLFFYIDLASNVSNIPGNNGFAQAMTIMMKPSLDIGFFMLVLASGLLYFGALHKSQ